MDQVTTLRVIFILGVFQAVVGSLILLSCRCFGGFSLGARFMKNPTFRGFYKYHCWLWWPFWVSVVAHVILAIGLTGWPF